MHVYLIHAQGTSRYKIGITSRSIEYRLRELNGEQSAYPLELIKYIRHSDYKEVEKHLHEKYAINRVHNEWFSFSPQQLAEVESYMSTLDTPISNIKPILKPRLQATVPKRQIPSFQISFFEWLLPVAIALLVIYACNQVPFFQPANQPIKLERKQ